MKERISFILNEVKKNKSEQIGLLAGCAGEGVFLYNAYSLLHDESLKYAAYTKFEDAFRIMESGVFVPKSFCSGIAGFGWALQYLKKYHLLEEDVCEILSVTDQLLSSAVDEFLVYRNHDLLHGACGVGVYFAERSVDNVIASQNIFKILNYLENNLVCEEENVFKWLSYDSHKKKYIYNISLSHGICGIISFLIRSLQFKQYKQRIERLIYGAVHYILNQEIDVRKYHCYFPNLSLEEEQDITPSRLAWCYGDPGIAITLYQAGIAMNNRAWIDKAIEVLLYASINRKGLHENRILDAGLCHGSAGIGQIFYRMWHNTQMNEFKDAADYWFRQTLQIGIIKDGIAGFKPFFPVDSNKQLDLFSMLEGVAGIGLALLTFYYQVQPNWDECLLLS